MFVRGLGFRVQGIEKKLETNIIRMENQLEKQMDRYMSYWQKLPLSGTLDSGHRGSRSLDYSS